MPLTNFASARPLPLPVVTPTIANGNNINPLAVSKDCTTVYAGQGAAGSTQNTLKQSTNDGTSWTDIHTFSSAVVGFHQLDNGEALVAVGYNTGSIWKSTGFVANPATATWAKVLDSSGAACFFRGEWTLHPWTSSGSLVIVNEYGTQTAASGGPFATKVWLSNDYGATWTVIFDLLTKFPGQNVLHMHASAYDPYWDRLWITHGDATGTGQNGIYYSDDRGVTWTSVPGSINSSGLANQVTTIAIMDNCILFLPDGVPAGIFRIARRGYRQMGTFSIAHMIRGGGGGQALGFQAWRNKTIPGSPLLMCNENGANSSNPGNGQVTGTYDGKHFFTVYRDAVPTSAHQGFYNAVGPTVSGKIVGTITDSRQANLSRFTATMPALPTLGQSAPMVGGKASIVNGGTIPHGLGVAPTRYTATGTVAGRQVSVTAVDATNLTISLTDSSGTAVAVAENVAWMAGV